MKLRGCRREVPCMELMRPCRCVVLVLIGRTEVRISWKLPCMYRLCGVTSSHMISATPSRAVERQWTPVALPYAKPPDLLPTDLPSVQDIRQSTAIINQRLGQTIVAVTPEMVVKYGTSTPERESQALPRAVRARLPGAAAVRHVPRRSGFVRRDATHTRPLARSRVAGAVGEGQRSPRGAPARSFRPSTECTMSTAEILWSLYRVSCGRRSSRRPSLLQQALRRSHLCPFRSEETLVAGLFKRHEEIVVENNQPRAKVEWYAAHLGWVH